MNHQINREQLSVGQWSEEISWRLLSASTVTPTEYALCTAVTVLAAVENQLIVIKNKRGWEFPAGKRERGETPCQAALREFTEETGLLFPFLSLQIVALKELTATQPQPKPDKPGEFFPFPHSYVWYFLTYLDEKFLPETFQGDVEKAVLKPIDEVKNLVIQSGQYSGLIEYLQKIKLLPKTDIHLIINQP
jgi:8-oxo-dGTP pyrophosphatase MutT (NUDIX family)